MLWGVVAQCPHHSRIYGVVGGWRVQGLSADTVSSLKHEEILVTRDENHRQDSERTAERGIETFSFCCISQVQLDDDFYSGIENETYPLLVHGPFVSEKALALLNRLVRISFNSKFLRLYVKFKQE